MGLMHWLFGTRTLPSRQQTVRYGDETGHSTEHAIVIQGASDSFVGISAEYAWLSARFGQRNKDWRLVRQAVRSVGAKNYDAMTLAFASGDEVTIYFDITEFYLGPRRTDDDATPVEH